MKPIEKKDQGKVVIIPNPPQNPTQKSETADQEAKTGSDKEEAKEETPEE